MPSVEEMAEDLRDRWWDAAEWPYYYDEADEHQHRVLCRYAEILRAKVRRLEDDVDRWRGNYNEMLKAYCEMFGPPPDGWGAVDKHNND